MSLAPDQGGYALSFWAQDAADEEPHALRINRMVFRNTVARISDLLSIGDLISRLGNLDPVAARKAALEVIQDDLSQAEGLDDLGKRLVQVERLLAAGDHGLTLEEFRRSHILSTLPFFSSRVPDLLLGEKGRRRRAEPGVPVEPLTIVSYDDTRVLCWQSQLRPWTPVTKTAYERLERGLSASGPSVQLVAAEAARRAQEGRRKGEEAEMRAKIDRRNDDPWADLSHDGDPSTILGLLRSLDEEDEEHAPWGGQGQEGQQG